MAAGPHSVGVAVGGGEVGALFPVLDAPLSNREEGGSAHVDEELFAVDEVGVAPRPVARGDQIDVRPADLPGAIHLVGVRHLVQVAGPADQPVGVPAAPVGLPGQPGTGRLGAVVGPDLATIPPADQPAPGRLQASRQHAEADDQLVQFAVVEGVDVEASELVEYRFESVP